MRFLFLTLTLGIGSGAHANPYVGDEQARRAGAKLFSQNCKACHGEGARGTSFAPPLATPWVRSSVPEAIASVLKNGRMRRGMPSFAHLPEPERRQIVTYLQSLP